MSKLTEIYKKVDFNKFTVRKSAEEEIIASEHFCKPHDKNTSDKAELFDLSLQETKRTSGRIAFS